MNALVSIQLKVRFLFHNNNNNDDDNDATPSPVNEIVGMDHYKNNQLMVVSTRTNTATNDIQKKQEMIVQVIDIVIRHRDRQPARDDGIRVYHQGSSNGGSCFNVIVTLTRDVNKQEAEWIMAHAEKCLGNILLIFSNFCQISKEETIDFVKRN